MDADRLPLADELDRAVEALADAFAERTIRHALIGGLATSLRGRLRTTQDAGFLIDVPQLALPGLLDDIAARGFRLDPAVVIRQYVRESMTSFTYGPVRIDWLKPVLPLYVRALSDAQPWDWCAGHSLRVATAEGLILAKMVAFRPQDRLDIDTLLIAANRDAIEIDLIRAEWAPFAESEAERTAWLEEAIERRVVRRE